MSSNVLKIKNTINKEVLNSFDKKIIQKFEFIPVNYKDGDFFAVIKNVSESKKLTVENIIKSQFKKSPINGIRFIQVSDQEFTDLLTAIDISVEIKNYTKDDIARVDAGQYFIKKGLINTLQFKDTAAESKKNNIPLASMLCIMGFISRSDLNEYLKHRYKFPMVEEMQLNISDKVKDILPEDFILTNRVLPLSSENGIFNVAMVNPEDKDVLRDLIYLTNEKPNPYTISYMEFEEITKKLFNEETRKTAEIIEQIEKESFDGEETLWEQVEKELQASTGSVAKFVYKIITDAIDAKASDIHIEPRLSTHVVRIRVDGILKQVLELPEKVEQAVITRFKVLARMNIAEHRRPQDGTFTINYKGQFYDFRLNSLPVSGKEKLVIRVLAPAVSLKSSGGNIVLAGAYPKDIEDINNMINSPNGVILTSGPTGSGKTTTLYSILRGLNKPEVNITTIEDPIEIKLEGINQSQVNPKAGITFASCLRAILRQDPDIILVGEIRDYETLEVAISAAMTGHLVLSTVHTNSAAATVTRLIEMGAKDYLVSSTLTGVIAQRLVRKLCDHCKEEYHASYEEAKHLFKNEEDIKNFMKQKIYRKKGCKYCDYQGYNGRLGVFEILPVTKEIKKLLAQGAHDIEIEEMARKNGMRTLSESCLQHILNGVSTTDEFFRVLGYVNE